MTDSKNKQPTRGQNRLSSQKENFDFELVDVQDQTNPAPIPLNNDDDYDFIDKMLGNEHFDDQDEQDANPVSADVVASEPTPIVPPAQVVPEIKTNFYVDYFDKRKKLKTTNPEPVLAAKVTQMADTPVQDTTTPTEQNHTEIPPSEQPVDSHTPIFNGSGMAVAVLSQFKSKQESINKQQEQLIQEFSQKIQSATTITYAAVAFGVVALVAAATLGVMLSETKSEVSDLAGTTTALKDNIRHISKSSPDDLEGTDPAIDQLNQKVEGVMEQLKEQSQVSNSGLKNEVTALQNKVSQLEKSAALAKATANVTNSRPLDTAVAVVDTKQVAEPIVKAALPANNTLKNKSITVVSDTAHSVKTPPPNKLLKKISAEQTTSIAVKPQTNKTANKSSDSPKKANDVLDKVQTDIPANDINNLVNPPAATVATTPKPTPTPSNNAARTPQTGAGNWTVNLGSSNKLDDAKKTAARFTQKGIPVTISPYKVKNETRYRLQVKGFKSKDEAATYGNKAKDTLKLNAVWINP